MSLDLCFCNILLFNIILNYAFWGTQIEGRWFFSTEKIFEKFKAFMLLMWIETSVQCTNAELKFTSGCFSLWLQFDAVVWDSSYWFILLEAAKNYRLPSVWGEIILERWSLSSEGKKQFWLVIFVSFFFFRKQTL